MTNAGQINDRVILGAFVYRAFLRVHRESILFLSGQAITALLLISVFALAFGVDQDLVPGVTVASFVAPGVIFFALSHSAFESSAGYLFESKINGSVQDFLMAPIGPALFVLGQAATPILHALTSGSLVLAILALFVPLSFTNVALVLGIMAGTASLFALLGILVALAAKRWEHYAVAEAFVVMPLALLSGAFFPLSLVPPAVQGLFLANPAYQAINALRFGLTGYSDSPALWGLVFLLSLCGLLGLYLTWLVGRGFGLKT